MAPSKDKLRILTLNTHSYMEADNGFCMDALAQAILREDVDVVALQEVNQSMDKPPADQRALLQSRFVSCEEGCPIREDHFALALVQQLENRGAAYYWTWSYAHRGYGKFDEGLSVLSKTPILETDAHFVSAPQGGCKRKAVGIKTRSPWGEAWFYTAHMGWWKDENDPFSGQWKRLDGICKTRTAPVYLMGDFNSPAHVRGEGYDMILSDGWQDCYARACVKDNGVTVGAAIDGWRSETVNPMRIDFIFAMQDGITETSRVIFNHTNYPVISDHFGVLVQEAR